MCVCVEQQAIEKNSRQMDQQIAELAARLADSQKETAEVTSQRNRAQAENAELARRLADAESQVGQLGRLRLALAQQVDEAKAVLEDEQRTRSKLATENRQLQVK
jgi:chromosome segregation ATPase